MHISAPFIRRPVATSLLSIALLLGGAVGYFLLPVSSLPEVEFPTINVQAQLPGASPETAASALATPLERQFGRIAGVTQMTSSSTLGGSNITLSSISIAISMVPRAMFRQPLMRHAANSQLTFQAIRAGGKLILQTHLF